MDWRRDRHELDAPLDSGRDRHELEPGKRSGTSPVAGLAPVDPGKRSATQALRFDPAQEFDALLSDARDSLGTLERAVVARDLDRAVSARARLLRGLTLLRESVVGAGSRAIERRGVVSALVALAKPVVDQVPDVSADMIRDRYRARGPLFSGRDAAGPSIDSAWEREHSAGERRTCPNPSRPCSTVKPVNRSPMRTVGPSRWVATSAVHAW